MRSVIVATVAFTMAQDASAQLRILPRNPIMHSAPTPWRHGLVVTPYHHVSRYPPGGFIAIAQPYGGWGYIEPQISIQVVAPVLAPPPRWPFAPVDLEGVDLDVVRPPWAPEQPRRGVPAVAPPAPEMAKRVEPKKEAPLEKPAPIQPPMPQPPPAKPDEESKRLIALGIAAFRDQEYGLAAQRFHQASEADPAAARPHFLLGQAYLALGKFREAVQTIGLGLGKDPAWPHGDFRPRFELYPLHPEDWPRHVSLLEDARDRQPQHAAYLFLLAYTYWFDDDRVRARRLFEELRPLVADPALVDLFLK